MREKQRKRKKKIGKKNNKLKRNLTYLVIILTIIIVAGCTNNAKKDSQSSESGRKYLLQLEEMDLNTVESKIEEHHRKIDSSAIEGGDFKTIYEDTIFMGDSITESLAFNEIVEEYKVIANMGDTVRKAINHIPTVEGIHPKNVVLLYGMNDVILFAETAEWNSIDKFKEDYKTLIMELKNKLPNTHIYVQSPLPVTDKATATNPRLTNDNLVRFRNAVMEVCKEVEVTYVDISGLAEPDSGLHEADGIHFKKEFYEMWLGYLRGFMNK